MGTPNFGNVGGGSNKSLGGDIVGSILKNPEIQTTIVNTLLGLFGGLITGLIAKIGQGKSVKVPAEERPNTMEPGFPDDKIIPAPPTPKPVKDLSAYTGAKLGISKAQYNREMFPDKYTSDNQFGLYHPSRQDVYNRNSKIWFDVTPLKGGKSVQYEEGKADGILWDPVFHFLYNGAETICKANRAVLQDTNNGSGRPIQVVEGDSVGVGFSSWDYTYGFVPQIQVGDNEGDYEVWVTFPMLGNLESEHVKFSVS